MIAYIYYLKCPITNDIKYVGQTINKLEKRLKGHIYETRRDVKLNKHLTHKQNWILDLIFRKLEHLMTIHLLEECTIKNVNEREIYWINYYKSNKLTNIDSGGQRNKVTEETKLKISIANKGEKNGMFGKRFTISDEDKEKRRLAMINSIKFQKSRKSEEYRQKISEVQKVDDWLLLDDEFNIIKVFNNSREVSEFLGCSKGNVKNARRDTRKLLKKYWVKYKKDYEQILQI